MTQSGKRLLGSLTTSLLMVPALLLGDSGPVIGDLSWMTGCWEGMQGQRKIEEHWTKPSGQTLLGMSRTVIQDKTVAFEFMRIHRDDSGFLFTAQPSGQKEASFRLKQATADGVTFENPEHDFPQRIIYRREPGGLFARIEGKRNGQERGMDFPMKRTPCE